jgi:hypothetical protein
MGDIVMAVLAKSAADPKGLYFLPWIIVIIIMVPLRAGFDVFEGKVSSRPARTRAVKPAASSGGDMIRGKDDVRPFYPIIVALVFSVILMAAGFATVAGVFFVHGAAAIVIGLLVAFWGISGFCLSAFGLQSALELQTYLIISPDGVTFKGKRDGKRDTFHIRWSDVIEFCVASPSSRDGQPWLVAVPRPGSPLIFRGPPSRLYDSDNNLILICDLWETGIQEHVVSGALNHWRPR